MAGDATNGDTLPTRDVGIQLLSQQVEVLFAAQIAARSEAADERARQLELQLKTVGLAMSMIPALTMEGIGAKVMVATILRDCGELMPSRALLMIEATITADMRDVQGPPLYELIT